MKSVSYVEVGDVFEGCSLAYETYASEVKPEAKLVARETHFHPAKLLVLMDPGHIVVKLRGRAAYMSGALSWTEKRAEIETVAKRLDDLVVAGMMVKV